MTINTPSSWPRPFHPPSEILGNQCLYPLLRGPSSRRHSRHFRCSCDGSFRVSACSGAGCLGGWSAFPGWVCATLLFFFFFNIIVFAYFGCAGSLLLLGLSPSCQGGAWASLAVEQGLQGVGASADAAPGLWSVGSVLGVHGLSCSEARGILPDQG